ncbi:MAG: alpha-galactosidase [Terracidiphilus sp.]
MKMNRRIFLSSTGVTALGLLAPRIAFAADSIASLGPTRTFGWKTDHLNLTFEVNAMQRLRQRDLLPMGVEAEKAKGSAGVEVAIQCSGENSPDWGMKQSIGQPGARLQFSGKREEQIRGGSRLVIVHTDPVLNLKVESFYDAFETTQLIRRWTRVTNVGEKHVGVEFLSSAMLHGLADPQQVDDELRIHLAVNSWMAEGQWLNLSPADLGFVQNERTCRSEASAGSVGSWSTEKFLPMAVVENTRRDLAWFWQIEHNGSWHWELSNDSETGNVADDVYAYLGGPDDLHSQAWKDLKPGQAYDTVPVAMGCVRGGFQEAVNALTAYRRTACERPHALNLQCPVIFNDYMNCLEGNPSEEKELPLIAAAAKAGCEYFVIDAGWYAEVGEDWSETIGAWLPCPRRWPHGLKFVLDQIRNAGMVPGLWIEPEVAGVHSQLAQQPDSWFFMRHGRRVLKNSRYLLDFRKPEVTAYLDQVIDRLVNEYGAGYLKMDYNVDSLEGTDQNAESPGQGLLEHNRAHLAWLDRIADRFPDLVIENCGSGGGRMDYAMLSRMQLQSATDQEDYLRLPAIITGCSAAVLPEQLASWSYPLPGADADQASFNLVTAMMCRIHQSGHLDQASDSGFNQVREGIATYKKVLRKHIPLSVPFYPLGMPNITDSHVAVALGMRAPDFSWLAVWRLDGPESVAIPIRAESARVLYPSALGIEAAYDGHSLVVRFPRPRMGCVIQL